jgi:hypothetical protein
MADDIVTRIRKEISFNGPNDTIQKDLLIRAANEIEQLRTLAHRLHMALDAHYGLLNPMIDPMMLKVVDDYKKATHVQS